MKRFLGFMLFALLLGGMVWGQVPTPLNPPLGDYSTLTDRSPLDFAFGRGYFVWNNGSGDPVSFEPDGFNAVPTISTEARYSAGIFGSDIDSYISVTDYDAEIGTFFFLGAFPSVPSFIGFDTPTVDPGVNETLIITDREDGLVISAGFARSFNNFYLGLYYGGSFIEHAEGYDDGESKLLNNNTYESQWRNNLAVLVGLENLGAFRLDLIINTDTDRTRTNSDNMTLERYYAPTVALSWGGLPLFGFNPFVTIGYKFPHKGEWGDYDAEEKYISATEKINGSFGLQLGASYDLSESSSVSAAVGFRTRSGRNLSGDHQGRDLAVGFAGLMPGSDEANAIFGTGTESFDVTIGGDWGIGLEVSYFQTIDAGMVAFGFSPTLGIGYMREKDDIAGKKTLERYATNTFQLNAGVDVGLRVTATEKLAFYTGLGLQLFNYERTTYSGGKEYDNDPDFGSGDTRLKESEWELDGFAWDDTKLATGGHLGIGMTYTPVENLIIGFGLNALLDKLFVIDVTSMQIRSGDFWYNDPMDPTLNLGSWAGRLFDGLTIDLTVSYRM